MCRTGKAGRYLFGGKEKSSGLEAHEKNSAFPGISRESNVYDLILFEVGI